METYNVMRNELMELSARVDSLQNEIADIQCDLCALCLNEEQVDKHLDEAYETLQSMWDKASDVMNSIAEACG